MKNLKLKKRLKRLNPIYYERVRVRRVEIKLATVLSIAKEARACGLNGQMYMMFMCAQVWEEELRRHYPHLWWVVPTGILMLYFIAVAFILWIPVPML